MFLTFLSVWFIIGLIVSLFTLVRDWRRGNDITVGNLIDSFIIMLAGPINIIVIVFTAVCDMFDKSSINGIYDRVVIRGRSKF